MASVTQIRKQVFNGLSDSMLLKFVLVTKMK